MFLRVVILVCAATCCTARVIDVKELQSAWERSGKFEGDIMLTEEQRKELFNNVVPFVTDGVFNVTELQSAWERSGKFKGDIMLTDERMRTGVINTARRWPNGVVPYVIDSVFSSAERNMIQWAIRDFHERTPISFRQYDPRTDTDYVHITGQNTGCWSYVGRIGGRQQLNLQRNGCMWHGIIIHELLHALGFVHMHSATDRDNYVTINWQNIEPGMESYFFAFSASVITSFGVPYDYDSVMHFGPYAFSRNGLRTIDPKDPNAQIGQINGFSEKDIERVIRMYENSSTATRSPFITLILIILDTCTHLQLPRNQYTMCTAAARAIRGTNFP